MSARHRPGIRYDDGVVFAAALMVRVAYMAMVGPSFEGPYWIVAGDWLGKTSARALGIVPTDFEPLYPAFLALVRVVAGDRPFVAQLVQTVIAACGAVIFARLTRAVAGERVSWCAAALYVCDPLLVKQSGEDAPFVLVALVVVGFVAAVAERRSLAATALGTALLVSSRIAALPLVACGVLLLLHRHDRVRATLVGAAAVATLIVSASVTGVWWPTRSGWNLYIASLPAASELAPVYDADALEPYAAAFVERQSAAGNRPLTDLDADRALTRAALSIFAADPGHALVGRFENLWHFFWPPLVPLMTRGEGAVVEIDSRGHLVSVRGGAARPRLERVVYVPYYSMILAAAVGGVLMRWRRWSGADSLFVAAVATFALVHGLYFPGTRYRGPVECVFLFYAGVVAERLARRLAPSHPSTATAA